MRFQPPHENNPSNPLIKVAALALDREVERVIANLTFKPSRDIRGKTKSRDGREINVVFSLALRRASFSIRFLSNLGIKERASIKIKKVAFAGPLVLTKRVSEDLVLNREIDRNLSVAADGQVGPISKGKIRAVFGLKKRNDSKYSRKVVSRREQTNVSVTFAKTEAHWEISPNAECEGDGGVLQGDVFRSHKTGRCIDACTFDRGQAKDFPTITSSVYVNMEDLSIDTVYFTDVNGASVEINEVEAESGKKMGLGIFRDDLKARILKQIIRKHLICQGMTVDGASIEICRAET